MPLGMDRWRARAEGNHFLAMNLSKLPETYAEHCTLFYCDKACQKVVRDYSDTSFCSFQSYDSLITQLAVDVQN